MTGTPSRTATAYDGGQARRSVMTGVNTPRGCVGRKLEAKLRSEEHEAYRRHSTGGRGRVGVRSPKVIRPGGCICDGCMERRSRVLPREVCLSVCETGSERGYGHSRKRGPGRSGCAYPTQEQTTHHAGSVERTREAERSTRDRQKSAESGSRQRRSAKEEHMETNRNGAFDG